MEVIYDTLTPKQQELTKISGVPGWSDHPKNGTKVKQKFTPKSTCTKLRMEVIYDTLTPKQQELCKISGGLGWSDHFR